ncbi:hypothetical protein DPSP01_006978 [Paraphaeosphaeria sporulosa]
MRAHYLYFVVLSGLCTALPVQDEGFISQFPVHTTNGADGSVIDWVPVNSQVDDDEVAAAPELPSIVALSASSSNQTSLIPQPITAEEHIGPEGTVPVVRQYGRLPDVKAPPQTINSSFAQQIHIGKRAIGDHWYASSAQNVVNHGGSATYSLYKAYTESNADFSLLQSAVIKYNVKNPLYNDPNRVAMQTVEAGWINYPNQVSAPHLFVYYTTNGYTTSANNQGGWNRDVTGWVQVDSSIYPGVSFTPLSTRGGAQYDIKIQWLLYKGNWWLFVLDRWIGYYPASLFGANTDASKSLQVGADAINYYGEIYDSHQSLTKTDMGSGTFPDKGYGQSAYIRNMVYTDSNGQDQKYDGSKGIVVSDTNRYRMSADWSGSGSWGSYMYLGGPGAGGQIGA